MKKSILISLISLVSCINPGGQKNKAQVVESMSKTIVQKNKDVKTVDAKSLMQMMQDKSFTSIIVDVRSDEEIRESVIPNAVPKKLFEKHKDKFKDKLIITYCTIGGRSSEYTRNLTKDGFQAASLKGGVLAWAHAGGTFDNGGTPTKKVRFLNDAWDLLPEGYEGVFP